MANRVTGNATAPSERDYQRLAAFRHTLRRFTSFSAQAAHEAGLTTSQHQALLSVKGHPGRAPMTIGQLAEHLVVAPHTAAELVGRLELDGMLTKVPDPSDRRRMGLRLTAKAEAALRVLSSIHLQEIRDLAPGLIETLEGLLSAEPRQVNAA